MNNKLLFNFLIIFLLAGIFSCSEKDKKTKVKNQRLRPVKVICAEKSYNGNIKSFSGITQSSVSSRLSFRVAGTLTELYVNVGDKVKKGQILAKLDPTDYEIKVQEVAASLSRADAQWQNAKAAYLRIEALYERGNASLNELDASKAAARSGEAVVKSVEKQLELVKKMLEYTTLVSPSDCSVAALNAEKNENVAAGYPVMLLNCGAKTEVKILVPSAYIDKVKKNALVKIEIDSIGSKQIPGRVKDVGFSPVGLMTTYPVIISVDKKFDGLRPGMSAMIFFTQKDMGGSPFIRIPLVCVGEDSKGKFIYKVINIEKEKGTIKKVYVDTGELNDSGISVLKGLSSGEMVVSAGVSQVADKMMVRIEK